MQVLQSHILLRGLAEVAGAQITQNLIEKDAPPTPPLPPLDRAKLLAKARPYWSWRDAGDILHVLVEIQAGLYLEWWNERPALLWERVGSSLEFCCTRATKDCRLCHSFDCKAMLIVDDKTGFIRSTADAKLFPLGEHTEGLDFLPTHKWAPHAADDTRTPCVIGFWGSLAPMHRGHVEMLDVAISFLGQTIS